MYERLLDSTKQYPDVQAVLTQLQRASRENHLPVLIEAMLEILMWR
jgi:hypothetical protein